MKKFIITEEEKSRILEMHQFATSRQYLMENVRVGVTKELLTQIANRINLNIERAKSKGKKISSVVSVVQEGNYNGVNAFVLKYGNNTFLSEFMSYPFSDRVLDSHTNSRPPYEVPLKIWGEGIASVFNNNKGMPKELQQLSDDSSNILKIYNTWASQFRQTKP